MTNLQSHWEGIYHGKNKADLGWSEADQNQTFDFLGTHLSKNPSCCFIAGAGASELPVKLDALGHQLLLNDISEKVLLTTLENLQKSARHSFVCADIGKPLPQSFLTEFSGKVDLWIDRATLHFLTTDQAIHHYFDNLRSVIKAGGKVMLAQFMIGGANQCAGLPVKQWTIDDYQTALGPDFRLVASQYYDFVSITGDVKPYVYGLFEKG